MTQLWFFISKYLTQEKDLNRTEVTTFFLNKHIPKSIPAFLWGVWHLVIQFQRDPFTFTQFIIWTLGKCTFLVPHSLSVQVTTPKNLSQLSFCDIAPCSSISKRSIHLYWTYCPDIIKKYLLMAFFNPSFFNRLCRNPKIYPSLPLVAWHLVIQFSKKSTHIYLSHWPENIKSACFWPLFGPIFLNSSCHKPENQSKPSFCDMTPGGTNLKRSILIYWSCCPNKKCQLTTMTAWYHYMNMQIFWSHIAT